MLKSKNMYLLPLQKNLLSDVLTHLKKRNIYNKDELELFDLFENVKVAEWDEDKRAYKTENGYFNMSDIHNKSFRLKNKG